MPDTLEARYHARRSCFFGSMFGQIGPTRRMVRQMPKFRKCRPEKNGGFREILRSNFYEDYQGPSGSWWHLIANPLPKGSGNDSLVPRSSTCGRACKGGHCQHHKSLDHKVLVVSA